MTAAALIGQTQSVEHQQQHQVEAGPLCAVALQYAFADGHVSLTDTPVDTDTSVQLKRQ